MRHSFFYYRGKQKGKSRMRSWILIVCLVYVHVASTLTPEEAIKIAKRKLPPFPDHKVGSFVKPYKKITKSSLRMSMRNALVKAALKEMEINGSSRAYDGNYIQEAMKKCGEELDHCDPDAKIDCTDKIKYRTIDGLCNNLHQPRLGARGFAFKRILESRYGNSKFKIQYFGQHYRQRGCYPSGQTLPNPRAVSSGYHLDSNRPSNLATHMFTQFGQFLDHDLTLTPEAHVEVPCCQDGSQEECIPISVSSRDSFFRRFRIRCLELTRSEQFCDSHPREQFNEVTSFVDASNVYGSEEELAEELRVPESYLLKTTITRTRQVLLPKINGSVVAGDERAIEMPGLATLHTLWVREHNRIAKILAEHRGKKSKEEIFQQTRRIVAAEMQNVVYGEYLPVLFGSHLYQQDLYLRQQSYYHPYADPTVTNSFATAAFRFGHTMIEGSIERRNIFNNKRITTFQLKDNFDNLAQYKASHGRGVEELISGLFTQPAQTPDRFVVDDVTNFLFRNPRKAFGQDLLARNIQRSREHGLPPYGAFRQACGLSPMCSWNNRPPRISYSDWGQLRRFYRNPNDIDLFVAGISETPTGNAQIGETFACIIGRQFRALRDGDRFFFTHSGQAGSFDLEQLRNLRRRTLSHIICDNTNIRQVPYHVFRRRSSKFICPKKSNLNLNLFK